MGKKGLLLHNLPLLLGLAGAVLVLRRRPRQRPECVLALAWCAGVWLIYAAASTNASGVCCSVRWFVPLLAGFFLLALLLRDFPEYERDLLWLSGWGAVLGAMMAWGGPWRETPRLAYWVVVGLALAGWMWIARQRHGTPAWSELSAAGQADSAGSAHPPARRAAQNSAA